MSRAPGRPSALAARMADSWTRAYTRRLPEPTARCRRDEVRSDVHDHLAAARAAGLSAWAASRAVAARMLLGVPADLSWRHQHLRAARAAGRKEVRMGAVGPDRGRVVASLAGVVVVAWTLYMGVGWTYQSTREDWSEGSWLGPLLVAIGILGVAGIVLLLRGRAEGAFLVALAAVGSTGWVLWAPAFPLAGLVVAGAFVWYGVVGRRTRLAAARVATG